MTPRTGYGPVVAPQAQSHSIPPNRLDSAASRVKLSKATATQESQGHNTVSGDDERAGAIRHVAVCSVCLEEVHLHHFPKTLHRRMETHISNTCIDCWRQHIRVAVEGGSTVLQCADSGCSAVLSLEDVERLADKAVYDE